MEATRRRPRAARSARSASSLASQAASASSSRRSSPLRQARVVRNGPVIGYKADPRQVDGDDNTFCGGDERRRLHHPELLGQRSCEQGRLHRYQDGEHGHAVLQWRQRRPPVQPAARRSEGSTETRPTARAATSSSSSSTSSSGSASLARLLQTFTESLDVRAGSTPARKASAPLSTFRRQRNVGAGSPSGPWRTGDLVPPAKGRTGSRP